VVRFTLWITLDYIVDLYCRLPGGGGGGGGRKKSHNFIRHQSQQKYKKANKK